jgi:endonuclease/exonuclease/phosphatase (EEP) superfamily protein YafD
MSARRAAAALAAGLLAACVTLTDDSRALIDSQRRGATEALRCDVARRAGEEPVSAGAEALDSQAIRVVSWNIHKQKNAGWEHDLARLAHENDLVLLQEATLDDALRRVIENAGHGWVMASSFRYAEHDIGVMTAARVRPVGTCTHRIGEPLIVVPKSTVITWYRLTGTRELLAIVNLHAINFSLLLGAYEQQLAALVDALAAHRGPLVLAGDFNTWTDARKQALLQSAARLGVAEASFPEDRRTLFLGKQVDHVLVRGLDTLSVSAIAVSSSDHNPVQATLRLTSSR